MANQLLHSRAIEMRKQYMSYSQIKDVLGVSKSTLSGWLKEYPLSRERINELRGKSDQRIELCRETKARKKSLRLKEVDEKVAKEIGTLSDREIFLCGLFLYWGEGAKTESVRVSVSNTDPGVLLFFIKWILLIGVPKEKLRVYVQLYRDMNVQEELTYWSQTLDLPLMAFRKPYIRASSRENLSYRQRFIHGTCNVIYDNRDVGEYVHASMRYLQNSFIAVRP
jgi:predicted transcriptional regulator